MPRWSQLVLSCALVLGACTAPADPPAGNDLGEALSLAEDDIVLASALRPFSACDELLDYFQNEALEIVGPYGLPEQGGGVDFSRRGIAPVPVPLPAGGEGVATASGSGAAGGSAPAADSAPVEGTDFSGTNVQEEGVDEPDIAKTDGRLLVTALDRRLRIIDLDDPGEVVGTLRLRGWDHELLLEGDRLLILTRAEPAMGFVPDEIRRSGMPDRWYQPVSVLTLVDISHPRDPRVESRLTVDGSYVSARMTGGVARVVVSSTPVAVPFVYPRTGGLRAERQATRDNRQVIEDSTVEDWLPYFVLEDVDSGATTEGSAVECDNVSRPPEFSGLGMLSVLSVDLADELAPHEATGVVASGETVYASAERLYVTTNRWFDPDRGARRAAPVEDYTTEIHAFDITDLAGAEYVASGSVPGHLLNQFSLSEHQGDLRVATTEGTPWAPVRGPNRSSSRVTVLRLRDGALREIGQVGDLGRGERIYSVRFLGDRGYVVTFRETDPLYSIDLSAPTAPRTTGELKIRGYSAYLHPVGEGLLLGVGQDATKRGRTLGTQVSLFDVSDPEAPRRVAHHTLPDSSSEAEWDHHAFLYWEPEELAVIPFESYRFERGQDFSSSGVRAFTVQPSGIDETGTVEHPTRHRGPGWQAPIRRSLVVDDQLITLSHTGVMVSDLQTLQERAFADFRR